MTIKTPTKGHAVGLPTFISRRAAMQSLAGAAILPSVATASPEPGDPILAHHAQWTAHRAEWDRLSVLPGHEMLNSPEIHAAQNGWYSALEAMADATPKGLAGIAALAHAFWNEFGPSGIEETDFWEERCEKTENKIIAAIWRAASGQDGLPPADGPEYTLSQGDGLTLIA